MAGKIRTKNSEQPNQKQALNRAGCCTYPDEDRPLSFPHLRLSAQALLPDEAQNQAGYTHRRFEPSAGPALAALLDLGLLFTGPSTPRCRCAIDRFPGIGRNASQIKNKRLNLNLDRSHLWKQTSDYRLENRSLYESMNPSEEGLNGYPSERVNEAQPRSLRWILSIFSDTSAAAIPEYFDEGARDPNLDARLNRTR